MLTFAAPSLALLAPAALALVLLAVRRGRLSLPRGRRAAAAAARGLLVLLLGAALARPVLTVPAERPFLTVFAVDVSASVRAFPDADLRAAWDRALAQGGRCALVAFAGRAEVLVPPVREPLPGTLAPARDRLEPSSTDFRAGVATARGLFRENATSRIVLVTDGRTPGRAVSELSVPPGTLGVRPAPPPGPDVAVVGVQAPAAVPAGEPFDARVVLESNGPADVTLSLTVDDAATPDAARKIRIERAGRHTILLPNVQQKSALSAGLHRLLAVASVEGDAEPRNNSGQAAFAVTGRPRVLIVEGRPADGELLARVLAAQDIESDRRSPAAADPDAFERYAAVVLAGVPRSALPEALLERLEAYVRRSGGGLAVVGSEALQGPEGYAGGRLEALLPLRFAETPPVAPQKAPTQPSPPKPPPPPPPMPDVPGPVQRVLAPAAAVLFVVDKSGSMAGTPITLVKEACIASARTLGEKDLVGVLAFDDRPHWVLDFTPANRQQFIAQQIQRLFAGGWTRIHPALAEAYRGFQMDPRARRCAVKHVVLLSDGETVPADFETLVRAMAEDGITVSTVCVGAGPRFDEQLMSRIAVWGGGDFKFTSSYQAVPQIFFTIVQKVLAAVPKDDAPPAAPPPKPPEPAVPAVPDPPKPEPSAPAAFAVVVKDPHQALDGLDTSALPPVHGRLDATPAPEANVAVALAMGDGKPLLAFGRAGLGRTAVWTSDLGGRWSRPWHAWKDTGKLAAQTVRHLLAEAPDVELAARVRATTDGDAAWIRVEAGEPVTLRDPATDEPVGLRTEEDGSLTARIPLEAPGVLKALQVQGADGRRVVLGAVKAYEGEFAPVGPGHDLFASRLPPLTWDGLPAALDGPPSTGERRIDLAVWLALAAALLLPLDVAIRRVRM